MPEIAVKPHTVPAPAHLIVLSIWPGFLQGGGTSVGTAVLNAPAPKGGIKVDLQSDMTAAGITVPSAVIVPEGNKLIDFPIHTAMVPRPVMAWITAKDGENVRTNTIQARPALMIASPVVGGNAVSASIALQRNAPKAGTVVAVSSDSPLVKPHPTEKIHAGDATLDISIPTSIVSKPTTAIITAKIEGKKMTQSVELLPIGVSIAWNSKSVAKAGISGTVNLSVPISKNLRFTISSDSHVVQTSTVTLSAGQSSAPFRIVPRREKSPETARIVARSGVLEASARLMIPAQ